MDTENEEDAMPNRGTTSVALLIIGIILFCGGLICGLMFNP